MKFYLDNWIVLGSPGVSEGEVCRVKLPFKDSGVLYVTYRDDANSRKVTVMKFN